MKKNNFAFFGTPDVASQTLETLFNCGYIPTVIITSPDRQSGRGMQQKETSVSAWAKTHSIPCLKPEKIDEEFIHEFKKYEIELSIVVAYGKILPAILISAPKLGTINIHYSLLPSYRGASPVEQALLACDTVTGVSIQQMAFKLDSGDLIATKEIVIDKDATKESLRRELIALGGKLLCEILPDIINRKIILQSQDHSLATYCTKIRKEDGEIDPNGNAIENYNKYRAYGGWPGIYFFTNKNGKKVRIKITKARFENDSFVIERVIPEGKKEIEYSLFLKSNNL